ncbi:MAG: hypothetical protein PHE55_12960 [Methylococcaceae bacterium]|nr:hypothetical protein [Methylococcaceae bacterium]
MANGENNGGNQSLWSNLRELIISPYVLFAVLGISVVGALGFGIYSAGGQFLDSLQKTEIARGLITFLVAVATVAIAIILALYAVVSSGPELKERFALGKEILTTLIGVLGTIVGFYFGSSTDIQTREPLPRNNQQGLQIAPFSISNEKPRKGEIISIASFVYGGRAPYRYTLSSLPSSMVSPISNVSQDGSIKEEIKLSDVIEKNRPFVLKIEANDVDGKSFTLEAKAKPIIVTE